MEVKVGVLHATRELVFESSESPEDIEGAVKKAVSDEDGVLVLLDEKGRRIMVPSAHLGYVEVGAATERRIGFSPEPV